MLRKNMKPFFIALVSLTIVACSTYQGSEIWRRSTCNGIADVDEKARCVDEASRTENEYKQDVQEATGK